MLHVQGGQESEQRFQQANILAKAIFPIENYSQDDDIIG